MLSIPRHNYAAELCVILGPYFQLRLKKLKIVPMPQNEKNGQNRHKKAIMPVIFDVTTPLDKGIDGHT